MVRFLRNCLMAKISNATPEHAATALLQISSDEQQRAARTSMLFAEEELTRFLQIMLRTFDDLGYRQEPRLHFELGLMKLVHLQRLLPMEELLSRMPAPPPMRGASSGSRSASAPATTSGSGSSVRATSSTPARATEPRNPEPRMSAGHSESNLISTEMTHGSLALAGTPLMQTRAAEPEIVKSEAVPPQSKLHDATTQTAATPEALQQAVCDALAEAGEGFLAEQLQASEWTIDGNELRVQTRILPAVMNTIYNKKAMQISRDAVRNAGGAHLTYVALPGNAETAASAAPAVPIAARPGTVQSRAMDHPMVQQAQKLFDAEIRSVIDLNKKRT
jgi:DNA polymerase-3 subunit gamma/tau